MSDRSIKQTFSGIGEIFSCRQRTENPPASKTLLSIIRRLFGYISLFLNLSEKISGSGIIHIIHQRKLSFYFQVVPIIILARFYTKKIILDYRDPEIFHEISNRNIFRIKILKYIDSVIVISDYQKQILNDIGINSHVIPEAVNISTINHRKINSIQPRILIRGTLERYHNVLAVVKALKIVKQKYPRSELVIVGEGSSKKSLQNYIEQGQIHGVSFVDYNDQSTVYEETDLFVNSLRFDYLPSSMLQAMSAGLPVISSPQSGDDKFVNRKNILFFRYNDHLSLADRIIELVENNELVKQLSNSGRKIALDYDVSQIHVKWKQLYSLITA